MMPSAQAVQLMPVGCRSSDASGSSVLSHYEIIRNSLTYCDNNGAQILMSLESIEVHCMCW